MHTNLITSPLLGTCMRSPVSTSPISLCGFKLFSSAPENCKMKSLKLAISFLVLFMVVDLSSAQVAATLEFTRMDNNRQYPIPAKSEEANIPANEPDLESFLSGAVGVQVIACVTGIWRFYPAINFESLNPAFLGYQIGANNKLTCYDIGQNGPALATMLSYRALGGANLDQQAIHIYSGEYGTGKEESYVATPGFAIGQIPTQFGAIVKSFVITGQHVASPFPPDNALAPVFKVIWDPFGNPNTADTRCYILASPNAGEEYGKMHYQDRMIYRDVDGLDKTVFMGALAYYTYADLLAVPEDKCPKSEFVGQSRNGVASFPRISY